MGMETNGQPTFLQERIVEVGDPPLRMNAEGIPQPARHSLPQEADSASFTKTCDNHIADDADDLFGDFCEATTLASTTTTITASNLAAMAAAVVSGDAASLFPRTNVQLDSTGSDFLASLATTSSGSNSQFLRTHVSTILGSTLSFDETLTSTLRNCEGSGQHCMVERESNAVATGILSQSSSSQFPPMDSIPLKHFPSMSHPNLVNSTLSNSNSNTSSSQTHATFGRHTETQYSAASTHTSFSTFPSVVLLSLRRGSNTSPASRVVGASSEENIAKGQPTIESGRSSPGMALGTSLAKSSTSFGVMSCAAADEELDNAELVGAFNASARVSQMLNLIGSNVPLDNTEYGSDTFGTFTKTEYTIGSTVNSMGKTVDMMTPTNNDFNFTDNGANGFANRTITSETATASAAAHNSDDETEDTEASMRALDATLSRASAMDKVPTQCSASASTSAVEGTFGFSPSFNVMHSLGVQLEPIKLIKPVSVEENPFLSYAMAMSRCDEISPPTTYESGDSMAPDPVVFTDQDISCAASNHAPGSITSDSLAKLSHTATLNGAEGLLAGSCQTSAEADGVCRNFLHASSGKSLSLYRSGELRAISFGSESDVLHSGDGEFEEGSRRTESTTKLSFTTPPELTQEDEANLLDSENDAEEDEFGEFTDAPVQPVVQTSTTSTPLTSTVSTKTSIITTPVRASESKAPPSPLMKPEKRSGEPLDSSLKSPLHASKRVRFSEDKPEIFEPPPHYMLKNDDDDEEESMQEEHSHNCDEEEEEEEDEEDDSTAFACGTRFTSAGVKSAIVPFTRITEDKAESNKPLASCGSSPKSAAAAAFFPLYTTAAVTKTTTPNTVSLNAPKKPSKDKTDSDFVFEREVDVDRLYSTLKQMDCALDTHDSDWNGPITPNHESMHGGCISGIRNDFQRAQAAGDAMDMTVSAMESLSFTRLTSVQVTGSREREMIGVGESLVVGESALLSHSNGSVDLPALSVDPVTAIQIAERHATRCREKLDTVLQQASEQQRGEPPIPVEEVMKKVQSLTVPETQSVRAKGKDIVNGTDSRDNEDGEAEKRDEERVETEGRVWRVHPSVPPPSIGGNISPAPPLQLPQ